MAKDGHTVLIGMDGSTEPSYLEKSVTAKAVNRKFRGGLNSTRPRFANTTEVFVNEDGVADPATEELFRTGNVQGAMAYQSTGPGYDAGLLVAIAGSIFFGKVSTQKIEWRQILSGAYDANLLHFWFVQGANMAYGQNGQERPFEWDGSGSATQLPESGPTPDGSSSSATYTPVGNIMAYSHGYIAVVNDINQIAISDHIYEYGFGNQGSMHIFSSNSDYKGGLFGVPANLGNITGAATIPQSRFRNGQGELVFFTENGAFALDLSPARELWEDTKTTLVGAGCAAPYSVIPVNNDLWYRRPDGISAYKQARNDEDTKWTDIPLSREVNNWLSKDSEWLLRYASMAYFDNRILCTVYPERILNKYGYGDHRYYNGLVALDLDPGSTTSNVEGGFGWDGLWTGPRPTQILTLDIAGRRRCFMFSLDKDQKNRTYELLTSSGKDLGKHDVQGFYVTRKMDFGSPDPKILMGGHGVRFISRGRSTLQVEYRPDDNPCWQKMSEEVGIGCDTCSEETCDPLRQYNALTVNLPAPEPGQCLPGTDSSTLIGEEFQFKVALKGDNDVKFFLANAKPQEEDNTVTCDQDCQPITCCTEYDFQYQWP